jgi:ubiquinone/menaquinone biosynthesis C-methylase UbiE
VGRETGELAVLPPRSGTRLMALVGNGVDELHFASIFLKEGIRGTMTANHNDNAYFIDAESGAEMARLIEQDRFVTRAMGGLLPPEIDLSRVDTILDLACGPGGWAQEIAFAHPEIEVIGVDSSQKMIGYASSLARAQGLENLRFQLMDAKQPLQFPDNTFDLVNARFITGFMAPPDWPRLIAECWRVTRPGGLLRMTESDSVGSTTSPAFATTSRIFAQAFHRAGRSLSPDGRDAGITPLLPRFFHQAGYQNIREQAHVLNFSQGAPAYNSQYENVKVALLLVQPFLVKTGVTTDQEWEELCNRVMMEMLEEDFCALWYFLSVWGEKPPS